MNNRIRKLAQQAGYSPLEPRAFADDLQEVFLQKFAELIVAECVSVVDGMADPEDSDRYFWAIQNASQKIKEHFGVEK